MFCVSFLARFCERPSAQHWACVKRVLRYLKGTMDWGIHSTSSDREEVITAYSDADWAGDKNDRKSASGFVVLFGSHPISWGSRKQTCVALSTMEAEYIALTAKELAWIHRLVSFWTFQDKSSSYTAITKLPLRCHRMQRYQTGPSTSNPVPLHSQPSRGGYYPSTAHCVR